MKIGWHCATVRLNLSSLPNIIFKLGGSRSMSSKIILDNISFNNNPSSFSDCLSLDITFTALSEIPQPLEWKVIYVGSARDEAYDQVLEEFEIGSIQEESTMKFSVECPGPDFTKIPKDQLICVTALIITVSYRSQEFIRVGYYVHNVLAEDLSEEERSQASSQHLVPLVRRTVLTDKPRITKFRINWGDHSMKEETNNARIQLQSPVNSNSSLLGRKMGRSDREERSTPEQKMSTREEKDPNSHSIIRSQLIKEEESRHQCPF